MGVVKVKLKFKSLSILMILTTVLFTFLAPGHVQAEQTIELEAESAILVDAETGKILYSKNADIALPPASMTKMMTEYLVWEAIESGEISWDQTTQISEYAYQISANPSFSGIGLQQDKDYTVKSLYQAMAINSDNATTIALAELIAGSEGEFVRRMNEKGEELGLPEFKFVNSTGLENESLGDNYPEGTDPNGVNLLSARSAALLAYHLVTDYPESLEVSSIPEIEFDDRLIRNYNWMLPHETTYLEQYHYEGVDGLKTGFTTLAGYCFTGTAEVNGKRLITVVMKTESEDARFKETARLLDYGFNHFESTVIIPSGYQLEEESTLPISKGKEKEVEIALKDGFTFPVFPGDENNYTVEYEIDESVLNEKGQLEAPIEAGTVVGKAKLVYTGEKDEGFIYDGNQDTVDLVTVDAVEKSNWFMIMIGAIGEFFANLFSTIVDTVTGWFS